MTAPRSFVSLGFLLSVAGFLGAAQPVFYSRQDYEVLYGFGQGPQAITVADFNRDGIPDMATASAILLGNGDGTFHFGQNTPNLAGAALASPDLNGDGIPDLVYSGAANGNNNGPYGIGVRLGNGDGTFQSQIFYQTGSDKFFDCIVVADFNHDGFPDVATQTESGIWLFLGRSGGLFSTGTLIPVPQTGSAGVVVAADVNNDGKLDLVAILPNGFGVLLGRGDGTFAPPITTIVPYSTYPAGLSVADLNGDGIPDVVVNDGPLGYNYVLVYFGKGNGRFSSPSEVYLPVFTTVAIGDVNGDGIPDLVSDGVYVALGEGQGKFANAYFLPVSGTVGDAYSVLLADLRKTGKLDIVSANLYYTISVLLNQGHGAFEDGVWSPLAGGQAGAATSMDFNGDGKPDLAVRVNTGVSVLLGTGKAGKPFQQGELIDLPDDPIGVLSGDFNGDGIPDLVAYSLAPAPATTMYVTVFLGNGDGTFTQKSVTTFATYGAIALGDFNGDGKLDFATQNNYLVLGNGDGTFQPPKPYIPYLVPPTDITGIATADLNGDGLTDVVLADGFYDRYYILINSPSGVFSETDFCTRCGGAQNFDPFTPIFGNLNGDRFPDMTFASVHGPVPLFLNDGTGHFSYQKTLTEPLVSDFMQPIIADLNGDGIPDIAVLTDYDVAVFFGTGHLNYEPPVYLGTGTLPGYFVLMNLHGQKPSDGKPDLVVPDSAQGKVLSILNLTK